MMNMHSPPSFIRRRCCPHRIRVWNICDIKRYSWALCVCTIMGFKFNGVKNRKVFRFVFAFCFEITMTPLCALIGHSYRMACVCPHIPHMLFTPSQSKSCPCSENGLGTRGDNRLAFYLWIFIFRRSSDINPSRIAFAASRLIVIPFSIRFFFFFLRSIKE